MTPDPFKGANHTISGAQKIPVLGSPMAQLDRAFAPPSDPMSPAPAGGVTAIYKDLPIVSIATEWTVQRVRAALHSNLIGMFDTPAMLADEMLGDDRVQATMGSRIAGLLGREVIFEPADDSIAAREVCDAWEPCWDGIGGYGSLGWMQAYFMLLGWAPAQLVWDTTGPVWRPQMRPWHQRFTYYHWTLRRYIALSQDGQISIEPGNGKWVLHAPWGDYRAWLFGGLRAVAEPWLIRHFAYRDWARYSEVHGIPIKLAGCPASADPTQRSQYEAQLQNLPSETTILLAKGMEGQGSDYTLDLLEATDTAWESFPGLIDRCDQSIVLALLFQNLTTEVKGGSFAATTAHMDIRQAGIERDNLGWIKTIREQIARPFAFLNFGDPNLAPKTRYDVQSLEQHAESAKLVTQLSQAINFLRQGGVRLKKPRAFFNGFGITLGPVEHVDPTQIEAKLAGAIGKADDAPEAEGETP